MIIDFINIKWYNYIHNTTLGRLINQKFHSSFTIYLKKGLAMEKNIKEDVHTIIALGISDFDSTYDKSYESVFERADKAMYENKKYLKEKYNMKGR